MATSALSPLSALSSFGRTPNPPPSLIVLPLRLPPLHCHANVFRGSSSAALLNIKNSRRRNTINSVAEDETLVPALAEDESSEQAPVGDEGEAEASNATAAAEQVSVPVSPSDVLTMFFQAEGTMNETAIPAVTDALQEIEGISDLKVKVLEGIASVELVKQTTIQATGVASKLVEIIQGSGFKLQTLNLSFEDEEDILAAS